MRELRKYIGLFGTHLLTINSWIISAGSYQSKHSLKQSLKFKVVYFDLQAINTYKEIMLECEEFFKSANNQMDFQVHKKVLKQEFKCHFGISFRKWVNLTFEKRENVTSLFISNYIYLLLSKRIFYLLVINNA